MRRGWDAHSYDRVSTVSDPLVEEVLARLQLRGDETVLDAGCGTGRVTARLLERLPGGRVVGVDLDPEMVSLARQRLPAEITVIESGLLDLSLPEPVDVIFSTATFHWVLDQDELFARLARLLRPGGRLVAQCGGAGALQRVIQAANAVAEEPRWQDHLAAFTPNWYFATPDETEQRLTRSGFIETRCWLQSFVFTPPEPVAFLETVTLGSWVQLLPDEQRRPFAEQVAQRLGEPLTIENVRLNIDARRA